jgi:hypothetical protein
MFQSRRKSPIISIMTLCVPLILLSLYTNGSKVAFAVPFPLLQIEERTPLTIAVNSTTGPVTVQPIIGAGGGGLCEKCQFTVYKPIISQSAPLTNRPVIAYTSTSPLDLSGAKRIVFFAKGELGGESIKVLAIGKPPTSVPTSPPTGFRFGAMSGDIVLTNNWKRYELNVDGLDLTNVSSPFALVISKQRGSTPIVPGPTSDRPPLNNANTNDISFYIKGVSIDNMPATQPINI